MDVDNVRKGTIETVFCTKFLGFFLSRGELRVRIIG